MYADPGAMNYSQVRHNNGHLGEAQCLYTEYLRKKIVVLLVHRLVVFDVGCMSAQAIMYGYKVDNSGNKSLKLL